MLTILDKVARKNVPLSLSYSNGKEQKQKLHVDSLNTFSQVSPFNFYWQFSNSTNREILEHYVGATDRSNENGTLTYKSY